MAFLKVFVVLLFTWVGVHLQSFPLLINPESRPPILIIVQVWAVVQLLLLFLPLAGLSFISTSKFIKVFLLKWCPLFFLLSIAL